MRFGIKRKLGECTTQWLILDLKTRRPAEKVLQDQGQFRMDAPPFLETGKIPLRSDLKEMANFQVRNSDLDLNAHVNNTRYAQWILDSVSEAKHREYSLKEYEVNFLAETMAEDHVTIFGGALSEEKFQFQGYRPKDKKVVFSATLSVVSQ